jgi:hypothetical protein
MKLVLFLIQIILFDSFIIKNVIIKNNYQKKKILIDNSNEIDIPTWDCGEIEWEFDDNYENDNKTVSIDFTKPIKPRLTRYSFKN